MSETISTMEVFRNMQIFVEVAKAQSFRRAADVLGMPNSTVSRRIAELERDIGLRLFNRTTRRVELTESGHRYFERCRRILQDAQLAHEELADMQARPSGTIRLSLPVDFSVIYLSPMLAQFAALYPGIRLELDLTPSQADLVAGSVDLAIRMGLPKEPTTLVNEGIYRYSRNPIYLGLFALSGASLIYAFSPLNLVAAVASVAIHHRIVQSEERFLSETFPEYESYRKAVRRYL
jgi:DNA-binding transcriptional LysR family regulator